MTDYSIYEGFYIPPHEIHVNIDTEYTDQHNIDPTVPPDTENYLLSYQWTTLVDRDGAIHAHTAIHYCQNGERLFPMELLTKAVAHLPNEDLYYIRTTRREGAVRKSPRLYVIAHFNGAEFLHLKRGSKTEKFLKSCRKIHKSFMEDGKPIFTKIWRNGNDFPMLIHLRDTINLTAPGTPLDTIGDLIGVPKIDIPLEDKKRMDLLLERDPELFERYALRDTEVTAVYFLFFIKRFRESKPACISNAWPGTVSAASLALLKERWGYKPFGRNNHLGRRGDGPNALLPNLAMKDENLKLFDPLMYSLKEERHTSQNPITGEITVREVLRRRPAYTIADDQYDEASDTFLGGRNQHFLHGRWSGPFYDYDLIGAYAAALCGIRSPDFSRMRQTTDLDEILDHWNCLGFARISFKFPEDCLYPCLPVKDHLGRGNLYNLAADFSDVCNATFPELKVAVSMGAEIFVHDAYLIPWLPEDAEYPLDRPFAGYIRETRARRNEAKACGDKTTDTFYKLMANSIYGKVSQGISSTKKSRNPRTGVSEKMPPSAVTCPYTASFVTGLVRATVSEILMNLPPHVRVLNLITDGICCSAGVAEMDAATQGPVATYFRSLEVIANDKDDLLEIKNARDADGNPIPAREMVSIKNRMYWESSGGTHKKLLAAVGVSRRGHKKELVEVLEEMWADSSWKTRLDKNRLTSLATVLEDLWADRDFSDLVNTTTATKVSFSWDFTRLPYSPEDHKGQLRFETRPHPNMQSFRDYRDAFENYGEPLKTCADLEQFIQYKETRASGARPRKGTTRKKQAVQMIADAASLGAAGLPEMRPREIRTLVQDYGEVSGDNYRKRRQRLLKGDIDPHRTLIASTTVTDIIEMVKCRHDGFTVKLDAGRYHLDLRESVTKTGENRKGGSPQSRRNSGKKGP